MAGKILVYDDVVASRIEKLVQRQVLYVEAFSTLHVKASQKANSLSGRKNYQTFISPLLSLLLLLLLLCRRREAGKWHI